MAYAGPEDVALRADEEILEESYPRIERLLEDAELIIRSRILDLDSRISTGSLNVETVIMVETNAVLRVLKNPKGFTQETDGNYSYAINASVASGLLDISDLEWGWLGASGGIFLINMKTEIPWRRDESDPWWWTVYAPEV